jgi:hypothetical protein
LEVAGCIVPHRLAIGRAAHAGRRTSTVRAFFVQVPQYIPVCAHLARCGTTAASEFGAPGGPLAVRRRSPFTQAPLSQDAFLLSAARMGSPWLPLRVHASGAASNAANIGLRVGANGLVTVTPRHVNPSCISSDRSNRHSASAEAASTTESQIVRP